MHLYIYICIQICIRMIGFPYIMCIYSLYIISQPSPQDAATPGAGLATLQRGLWKPRGGRLGSRAAHRGRRAVCFAMGAAEAG